MVYYNEGQAKLIYQDRAAGATYDELVSKYNLSFIVVKRLVQVYAQDNGLPIPPPVPSRTRVVREKKGRKRILSVEEQEKRREEVDEMVRTFEEQRAAQEKE